MEETITFENGTHINKALEENEVILYDLDENEIVLKLRRPSMHVKDKLLDLSLKFLAEQAQFEKENPEIKEMRDKMIYLQAKNDSNNLSAEELASTLVDTNNPEMVISVQEKANQSIRIQDKYSILKFKEIVNTKHLSDQQLSLFKTDHTSQFWQLQDLTQIEKGLNFFRINYQIG